eukprot:10199447-Lingulodinium_polyedra.AAC.1
MSWANPSGEGLQWGVCRAARRVLFGALRRGPSAPPGDGLATPLGASLATRAWGAASKQAPSCG